MLVFSHKICGRHLQGQHINYNTGLGTTKKCHENALGDSTYHSCNTRFSFLYENEPLKQGQTAIFYLIKSTTNTTAINHWYKLHHSVYHEMCRGPGMVVVQVERVASMCEFLVTLFYWIWVQIFVHIALKMHFLFLFW